MPLMTSTGAPLYLRGDRIFAGVIADLLQRRGLAQARAVVLTGCSSGALGALLKLERLQVHTLPAHQFPPQPHAHHRCRGFPAPTMPLRSDRSVLCASTDAPPAPSTG